MASQTKMKFPDWLKQKISTTDFKDLQWMDDRGKFKLPWVREGNDPHWESYYELFHAWDQRNGGARHKNSEVKQKFRAALNKTKCIEEVKEESEKDRQFGSFKVYRFLTSEEMSYALSSGYGSPGSSSRERGEDSVSCFSTPREDIDENYYSQQPLGIVVEETCVVAPSNEVSLIPQSDSNPDAVISDISMPSCHSDQQCDMIQFMFSSMSIQPAMLEMCMVKISYNEGEVFCDDVRDFGNKYRVYYRDEYELPSQNPNCIELPHRPVLNKTIFSKIIANLGEGFMIWYDREQMTYYLKRLKTCDVHIFYFDPHDPDKEAVKADKNKLIKIFSYESYCYQLYQNGFLNEFTNLPEIIIAIGCRPTKRDYIKGIKILLKPNGALKMHQENLSHASVELSLPSTGLESAFSNMST